MEEIWKPIPGYDGWYEASSLGRIRTNHYMNGSEVRVMKYEQNQDHYCRVELRKQGTRKKHMVHQLIALTFIPNPEGKPYVDHKDGNRHNNAVDNLRWCTHAENMNFPGVRNTMSIIRQGSLNHYAKSIKQYTLDGILVKEWDCMSVAARAYNVSIAAISSCASGKLAHVKGYVWRV